MNGNKFSGKRLRKHLALFVISLFLFCTISFSNHVRGEFLNNSTEEKFDSDFFYSIFEGAMVVDVGTGYPADAIAWCNFEEAFDDYPELKQNHGDYKLAILDSGIDEVVWDEFDEDFGDYLDIHYVDENGDEWLKDYAKDRCSSHHGTMMTSIVVQCLEREDGDVYADITMFQVFDYNGELDPELIEDQLQWIIDWNDEEDEKFKVISMSLGTAEPVYPKYFDDEIEELVNDQNCLIIVASGNKASLDKYIYEYVEDVAVFPANMPEVFGVGAFYGSKETSGLNYSRMSTLNDTTTNGFYVGSRYSQYIDNEKIDFSEKTVHLSAPGLNVSAKCDYYDNDTIYNVVATGTSMAVPQVAAAALLAARKGYYDHSTDYITPDRFFACIYQSSENDPNSRTKSTAEREIVNEVGLPTSNLGSYTKFYSYKIGYGSLDVQDMIEFVANLS